MSNHIELDDYQAVNLLSALRASGIQNGYASAEKMPKPNALEVLNSGDWTGEIIHKLEDRLELNPGQSANQFHSKRYGIMYPNLTPTEYVLKATQRLEEHQAEIARLYKERVTALVDHVNKMKDE